MIDLTQDEIRLIIQLLANMQVRCTYDDVTRMLELIKKLEDAMEEEDATKE